MARRLFGVRYTVSRLTWPQCGHESSSGSSRRIADGFMTPPESWCAPATRPFSMTATGTSPSFSVSSGSSASSCNRRIAQAMPAWPPPTIATPTSMRSSSGSVGGPTNSAAESTGGGNWLGATLTLGASLRFHGLRQLRHDLVEIADDAEVGELEDRGVGVLVDRHDVLGALHAHLVLDRAGDAGGEVELRRDGLARLADLGGVRVPAGVDYRAGGGDRAAERVRELLELLEALGLAQAAAPRDEEVRVLDVHVGAALLAALDHLGLQRVRAELDIEVLDRGGAAAFASLERVQAPDDHAELRSIVHRGDLRVLQDRPLGDELAVFDADVGDLHADAAVQPRGQAGADLEAEQAAAEERVLVAAGFDRRGHRVDHQLGKTLGSCDAVDLRRAPIAELGGEVVGHLADHDRVALGAELAGELRALGDRPERVLVERAVVVQRVDQDRAHASSFLSSSHATIFSTVSLVSSSSMIWPADLAGGAANSEQWARALSNPTRAASMPTSDADLASSGFFLAPMIAFSDG